MFFPSPLWERVVLSRVFAGRDRVRKPDGLNSN